MKKYVTVLTEEIGADTMSGFLGQKYIADTIYFGGGTPSALPYGEITRIFDALNNAYTPNAEITIEVNPGTLTEKKAAEYAACGINRASLGLQTDRDDLLKKINRPHTYNMFLSAVDMLKKAGINNISADIMLGLPEQTVFDVKNTVQKIIDLGLNHISAYALKTEEGTPLFTIQKYFADDELCADMYESVCGMLKAAGYDRYEVSNFARAGFLSRHNMKYWQLNDYRGYGAAAHSYAGGKRYFNTEDIDIYLTGKSQAADEESDFTEEMLMLNIRTAKGLDLSLYEKTCGIDLYTYKAKELTELLTGGFIVIEDGFIRLTDKGFYVMNSVILKLMPE